MYDYSHEKTYSIEDVSYEINILGVKASVLPNLFGVMLGSLFLGSAIGIAALPLFFSLFVSACVFSNKAFKSELSGRPFEYDPFMQKINKRFHFVSSIVPTLEAINNPSQGRYRG